MAALTPLDVLSGIATVTLVVIENARTMAAAAAIVSLILCMSFAPSVVAH
jgi:hypothetical protein